MNRTRALIALVFVGVLVALGVVLSHGHRSHGHRSRPHHVTASYNAAVLAADPVAFWDMSASAPVEADLSGQGHSGSYRGGTPTPATLPDGEPAADFNGRGEYLSIPSSPEFSISHTGELTWEGWIRPDVLRFDRSSDPQSYGYVDWMGKCENYSPSCEWEARMYSSVNSQGRCDRLSAYVFNPDAGLGSAADWQPTCGLLSPGRWLYVVGEYQTQSAPSGCGGAHPGSINIWVNAVKQDFAEHSPTGCMSQYAVTPRAGNSPLDIGTMAMDTWFPGAVGKVAIYDYLLSQAQIDAHFAAMTGLRPAGGCAETCSIRELAPQVR